MIRSPIRLLVVPLCVCVADAATAQRHAFNGITWHAPAESIREPLRALGFAFSAEMDGGDHAFTRPDGARLHAELRQGRLVGFTLIDAARGGEVDGRFHALADSLQALLGEPDEVQIEGQPPMRMWEAGLTSVRVQISRATGERTAQVAWRGPGWFDEMDRRAGRSPQPAGYTTVSISPFLRIAVDTTVRAPRAQGSMRGRFRIEYFQPITPSMGGVAQDPMDAVEYEMEFDCAGRRTRLLSRTTYLQGRQVRAERWQNQAWTTPAQPEGHYARGLAAVCRVARPLR